MGLAQVGGKMKRGASEGKDLKERGACLPRGQSSEKKGNWNKKNEKSGTN